MSGRVTPKVPRLLCLLCPVARVTYDQADVLAEATLVVCHGGSGTTYGALASGVPLVMVPVFADQFANAPVVAQAGAGIQVRTGQDCEGLRRPVSREDAPRIRDAIEEVLADGSHPAAAQAIAAETATAPAIETLLEQLPSSLSTVIASSAPSCCLARHACRRLREHSHRTDGTHEDHRVGRPYPPQLL